MCGSTALGAEGWGLEVGGVANTFTGASKTRVGCAGCGGAGNSPSKLGTSSVPEAGGKCGAAFSGAAEGSGGAAIGGSTAGASTPSGGATDCSDVRSAAGAGVAVESADDVAPWPCVSSDVYHSLGSIS